LANSATRTGNSTTFRHGERAAFHRGGASVAIRPCRRQHADAKLGEAAIALQSRAACVGRVRAKGVPLQSLFVVTRSELILPYFPPLARDSRPEHPVHKIK
jgi:hypothetical protein